MSSSSDLNPSAIVHSPSWSRCILCEQHFTSASEFARHLRSYHCRKEGGSFVCHYGPNNVCPSLPVDGVSIKDYDAHVHNHHVRPNDRRSVSAESPSEEERRKWIPYISQVNLPAVLNDPG